MNIINDIALKRKRLIKQKGHAQGVSLPDHRDVPLVPFGQDPFIICEIKRSSPSRGVIVEKADALKQARLYVFSGIKTVSVLTEEEHFSGSLLDLREVKKAYPGVCVLRKDFLLDEEDIEVSFRAGADAVLLISALHNKKSLIRLYKKAKSLGMEILLEVHDEKDLEKASAIEPHFTGFNSRDLKSFNIDLIQPLKLLNLVNWKTESVFESGILSEEDAAFVFASGFKGALVGESVMKDPGFISVILGLKIRIDQQRKTRALDFWPRLYARLGQKLQETRRVKNFLNKSYENYFPLIKICGITNEKDAFLAVDLGADILGFVFAPSPRRAQPSLLERLSCLDVLKVGVVVCKETASLQRDVLNLIEGNLLDAVQFHGSEKPDQCYRAAFPYFKAVRMKGTSDIERASRYHCPRVLLDAFSPDAQGGTGKSIPDELIRYAGERFRLWLAGGIGPENVRRIIRDFKPELIDASSRLEASPGIKEPSKMKTFFEEIRLGSVL